MDYKVVSLLALMITTVLSVPYPQPIDATSLDLTDTKCPCAKTYFPLCASDGNNYNNICEFKCKARSIEKRIGIAMFVIKLARCEENE